MTNGEWRAPGCPDCNNEGITQKRPNPYPAKRCFTHHNAKKKQRRAVAKAQRWERVYSLTSDQYEALYASQGGKCAICGIGRGLTKSLYVDHDHACCDGPTSCGQCIRGLIDEPCNTYLGRIRDSIEAAERLLKYLKDPPARRVLDNWSD